jgi:hypothetical protein
MAVTGGEKWEPEQAAEPSSPEPSVDNANPEVTTPEQEARRESGERIR